MDIVFWMKRIPGNHFCRCIPKKNIKINFFRNSILFNNDCKVNRNEPELSWIWHLLYSCLMIFLFYSDIKCWRPPIFFANLTQKDRAYYQVGDLGQKNWLSQVYTLYLRLFFKNGGKKVLITSLGFLGSHLCDRFYCGGWYRDGMDNPGYRKFKNIEHLFKLKQYNYHDVK